MKASRLAAHLWTASYKSGCKSLHTVDEDCWENGSSNLVSLIAMMVGGTHFMIVFHLCNVKKWMVPMDFCSYNDVWKLYVIHILSQFHSK
jgi:hypothetical protein